MSLSTQGEIFKEMVVNAVSRPTARDKQVKAGPSELGSCAFCLGYTMARKWYDLPERDGSGFGYAAFLGTALHHWFESQLVLPVDTLREHKLDTVTIEGYGLIRGTADLIVPSMGLVIDYKFPGKWSYDTYAYLHRTGGSLPNNYTYQGQIYAYGAHRMGIPVERCMVFLFPRHTNSLRDLLVWDVPYRPELVDRVVRRAEAIVEDIHDGNLWALPSDDDCFMCEKHGRPEEINNYRESSRREQAA